MIPRRIYLKGFMSYRDEAELCFDDARLWMLSGRNGAGKSAIFDAIMYALYGKHRDGAQYSDRLINQQADRLLVEFDFAVGPNTYRIKRTLPRKGQPTCQAFLLNGSHENPIPQTSSVTELKQWVLDTIGLDARTFTAAVLLCQGESEALLKAEPKARHEMLSQIVDLSAYIRLYDQADKRCKELQADVRAYRAQLAGLAQVDEAQLEALQAQIACAEEERNKAQEQILRLGELKARAEQWAKLIEQRCQVELHLAEARELMAQAEQIRAQKARLDDLAQALPLLQDLLDERQRLREIEEAIAHSHKMALHWEEQAQQAKTQAHQIETGLDQLQGEQRSWQQQKDAATQARLALAGPLSDLADLSRHRHQWIYFNRQLAVFPADLDAQKARLENLVATLNELQTALPWLRQFVQARTTWQQASAVIRQATEDLANVTAHLPIQVVEQGITTAHAYTERVQKALSQAQARLEDANERLRRFEEVEEQATCSYCGQTLSPEHLEAERSRLELAVQGAQTLVQKLQRLFAGASRLLEAEQKAKQVLEEAQRDQSAAEGQVSAAFAVLPTSYQHRIQPLATVSLLESSHPTDEELGRLGTQVKQHSEKKSRLQILLQQAKERDKWLNQREAIEPRLRVLEEQYPGKREQEIRAEAEATQKQQEEADRHLRRSASMLQEQQQALNRARGNLKQAEQQQQEALANVQVGQSRQSELQRTISKKEAQLAETWRAEAAVLTVDRLAIWQVEEQSLAPVEEQYRKLEEAQREYADQTNQLADLQQQISEVPPEAQCPGAELEEQERQTREALKQADQSRDDARSQKQTVENQREQRAALEKLAREAEHQEALYRDLARLLGREGLQRHLLEQAEYNIAANANQVLERLSGGTLRLELQQVAVQTPDTGRRDSTKVLDWVAYNSEIGPGPLSVGLLSGSQRFRIAVSLALGIGQYASQGTRHIESVIIDEGFGGLDKEGRQQMIDELHVLKKELSRIILVSHQEDFADAFSTGYEVTLVDGASRARLLERSS